MSNDFLRNTDWLLSHLDDSKVRIFDSTTILKPDPETTFRVVPGREAYDAGHIPGAGFIDLQGSLSATNSSLRFTLPSADAFAAAVGELGISNTHHVVLYSTTNPMWATRVWWMFRVFGHDQVSVLDGGFSKWQQEGKPVTTDLPAWEPVSYQASLDGSRVADRSAVTAAIEDGATCILNSLSREQFTGEGANYGRPGRIKRSTNLPWSELLDDDGCFLPEPSLRQALSLAGALDAPKVITYCGGGIAASVDLFALALLGMEDKVQLYDNSLSEWARDESLPMETG